MPPIAPLDASRLATTPVAPSSPAPTTAAKIAPGAASPDLPPGRTTAVPGDSAPGAPAIMVGRTRPRDISLPRFDLDAAIGDPAFVARDPATLAVPDELLTAIDGAKRVLITSHVAPDGDSAGSCLALARALQALGKEVDICVDDDVPGELRQLDRDHALKRPADLTGRDWELGIIIDTSVPSRIGSVNTKLLPHVQKLAVVDHHLTDPRADDFGVDPGTPFVRWMETDFPAASLLAGALISRWRPQLEARHADLEAILTPALAGFGSDTSWGVIQGLDPDYFHYFKHMLFDAAPTTTGAVKSLLDSFSLPERVRELATGHVRPAACGLPPALLAELDSLEAVGRGVVRKLLPGQDGGPAVGVITVSRAYLEALTAVGRLDDPRLVPLDLVAVFKNDMVRELGQRGARLVAFLQEAENGDIIGSFRSEADNSAFRVASSLARDGGGHDKRAGARVSGASLAEVERRVVTWAREAGLVA